ncbi:hypothetical protein GWI33_015987 [Rhynchophorus ferrugineus]|uniref:Protein Spindly n=1 Tax=Rhynchophorus ferrugineus TaxID=354439 RepID=A0A834I304_RHYFE|nr:hypothetical protein GWI33_015987 [Rhynchophorus ferrugineus]
MDNNRTVIADDYDGLLNQYNNLKCELDVIKQQLYDTTRQAKLNEALLKDYQNEIELFQKVETAEKNKWENKISRLEETLSNLRLRHSEDILQLETELAETQQENEYLKDQNEILKQTNLTKQQAEISINCDETLNLRNNYDLLLEKHQELQEAFEISQIKQIQMEKDIEQYKEELEQFKELYEDKRSEVLEYATLNEKLNEELLYAQRELEINKHKPLEENSKGNSLFAEVDDRRVYLQKTVNDMKSDYIRMKQERGELIKQISNLRKENVDLQTRWKKDIEQIEEDKQMVSDSLQSHLKLLQDIIDKQKIELEEKPKSSEDNLSLEYKFYQDMIDCKHQEVKELEEKLSKKSLGEYLLTSSLAHANKEIRQLRLKIMEKRKDNNVDISKDAATTHAPQPVEVNRTLNKGYLKSKNNAIKEENQEETLIFHETQNNSTDVFNVFNNRDTKKYNHVNLKINPESLLPKIDKIVLDEVPKLESNEAKENGDQTTKATLDELQETKCDENKENVKAVKEQPIKVKKAVTFSQDTADNTSGLARRRGTRIFSAPKKMF